MSVEPVVVQSYFAQWRRTSTNRWSKIHWFRRGQWACGITEPDDAVDFFLPPEPLLTCAMCKRKNLAMQFEDGLKRAARRLAS